MTDHAAEARKILAEIVAGEGNLPADWCGASDDEQWLVMGGFAEAQVHATLALVEQQRTANELAFLRFTLGEIQGDRASDVDEEALQALAERVTTGLGL